MYLLAGKDRERITRRNSAWPCRLFAGQACWRGRRAARGIFPHPCFQSREGQFLSKKGKANTRKSPFWRGMFERHVVSNAIRVSLFVGLCLNAINQGPSLWHGDDLEWGKALLNFAVPYLVASYSAARTNRLQG